MLLLTFSKAGCDDITLTEDDLFDFEYEAGCFSGETFELGGVNARSIYLLIDNNDRRFSRGTFANTRITLEIDGNFYGRYNAELPKRRDGVIELTAYDDMTKLDIDFPEDFIFPAPFPTVYANCVYEAGLAPDKLHENVVLNAVLNNGLIADDYDEYVYANSCRKVVAGMAEWNGGFAYINNDNKLQVDAFSKEVKKTLYSGDLMELDYSDETVTFSKVRTSQKNKTYEMGDDSGYTLVINNQYISYGLTDEAFEMYLTYLYEYYNGFTLTPMSFILAEPDFELKLGDRISVVDEEEDITVTGNISKITISGNCSMSVTCGGFGNVASANNYTPTSVSQTAQAKTEAVQQVTSTASSLYEYEYLTDLSAKCNGVTYTAEKNEAGLISKISDDAGNAIEPTASGDITDIGWHNAVLMAVAMCKGIGTPYIPPVYDIIVAGEEARYGDYFKGFAKSVTNAFSSFWFSSINGKGYVYFAKDYCITDSQDGYTDSVVYRSIEPILMTSYSELVIKACLFTNNYGYPSPVLDGCAYITFGNVPDPAENAAYDWTDWQKFITNDKLFYAQLDTLDPVNAASTEYVIDISNLTGMQRINIGLWRNDIRSGYSVYLVVSEMYLK